MDFSNRDLVYLSRAISLQIIFLYQGCEVPKSDSFQAVPLQSIINESYGFFQLFRAPLSCVFEICVLVFSTPPPLF